MILTEFIEKLVHEADVNRSFCLDMAKACLAANDPLWAFWKNKSDVWYDHMLEAMELWGKSTNLDLDVIESGSK